LIVPKNVPKALRAAAEHDKLECYQGSKATNSYGISVEGAGAWAKGKIKGTLDSYEYKALYEVYKLKQN
jgi:hypothetical protein